MTLFEFLLTPVGLQLIQAITLLLVAVTGWVSYQTKKQSEANGKALDGHLDSHKILTDVEHNHNP